MTETTVQNSEAIHRAFTAQEQNIRTRNYRIACVIAAIFMPAGVTLDFFVYREEVGSFFLARILCSILLMLIWWAIKTPFGLKHQQILGLVLPGLPTLFISWMIWKTQGAESSYYAGLNLVLLGAAIILRWNVRTSVLVCAEVMSFYFAACWLHQFRTDSTVIDWSRFYNNLYFITVTGVFVVVSSFYYNQLRFSEFSLRYELDLNRRELEKSNEKLLELGQVKDRFFANISHELRTPLTLLISPLEVLLFQKSFAADDEPKELLQTMHGNAMRLLKLINDLLDLVRLESGRMEVKREPMQINEFARSIIDATKQLAEEKRIQLVPMVASDISSFVGDRDKLEKICLNLIFNALKFTPAEGRVELSCRRAGDEIEFSVKDTGVGIPAKQLPYVFDRFWQADNSSKRKYKGVGIGLSLVKEFVEIQGGKVTVESEEGKGTTFTVRLPYVPSVPQPSENGAEPKPESGSPENTAPAAHSEEWLANLYRRAEMFPVMDRGAKPVAAKFSNGALPTALVADDEPAMVQFISSQIKSRYQVVEAVDGQEAIEKALQHVPDIILLDMNMPEKDGLQVCRELRATQATQKIPVILITARADEETKLAALSAGANDFLSKPFSVAELFVRIRNLVESHDYQLQLSKQNQVLESTIEQLKETETALVQSEKLASLGRMSAGIIHEINNPLNFATTGLFALRGKGKLLADQQREEFTDILNDVEEGVKRVKNIVSDLRMFTHPGTDQLDEVSLAEVIHSSIRFLSGEFKNGIELEQSVVEGLCVRANKNKLIHVLVNLLQNSLDALRRKEFQSDEKPQILIRSVSDRGTTSLVVRDNGPGIDQANLDKIFDPFFTTKDVGEGMGLGLSICYRIIQDFDGRISVKTEPGKYCEFALEFPPMGRKADASLNQEF